MGVIIKVASNLPGRLKFKEMSHVPCTLCDIDAIVDGKTLKCGVVAGGATRYKCCFSCLALFKRFIISVNEISRFVSVSIDTFCFFSKSGSAGSAGFTLFRVLLFIPSSILLLLPFLLFLALYWSSSSNDISSCKLKFLRTLRRNCSYACTTFSVFALIRSPVLLNCSNGFIEDVSFFFSFPFFVADTIFA